jgi:hypothetical protein
MSDFSLTAGGKIAGKSKASKSPESGIEIVADDGERLELRDDTRDEAILGFCATVGLEDTS